MVSVLLSGGLDSSTALMTFAAEQLPGAVEALFIDYGQPAAAHELRAAHSIAQHVGTPMRTLQVGGIDIGEGEITGRNALLVHAAYAAFTARAGAIVLSIHAGTRYRDCSPEFVATMQDSLDFHSNGAVRLATPFLGLNKAEVFDVAVTSGVPLDKTRSCEGPDARPCGRCRSCRDMELLRARS
jgi:7-cyano-7-deazaguanine synthase